MPKRRQSTGSATALALALGAAVAAALLAGKSGLLEPAHAQGDADKRRREPDRQRTQPPPPSAKPPPSYKPPHSQPKATAPPPPRVPLQKHQPPPAAKSPPPKPPSAPERRKETIERRPPPVPAPPRKEKPPGIEKAVPPSREPPAIRKAAPPAAKPPAPAFRRVEELRKERRERVEAGGRRRVLSEPGNRFIVKERDRSIIRHDEAARFLRRPGARSERRNDGSVETWYVRRDGVRIVTVVDRYGRLLRRFRRDRNGREYSIIDNRRFYRGVAIGAIGIIALSLPPPHVTIPMERYIVDYESASDDDLYETLEAPPVEALERAYSLEEVLDTWELRARMRRIDLATITFESGAWEVPPDQHGRLERVARAILRVLRDNPEAVFLIEGHTDAVGSEDDNLSLSDRRAQAVAEILTDAYDVPPENLVTQGYGEQHLKIAADGPEPRNRRVSIVNIAPLMAER
jgi:outer membrane protein OmpA-like peptidoglycan-associated protein